MPPKSSAFTVVSVLVLLALAGVALAALGPTPAAPIPRLAGSAAKSRAVALSPNLSFLLVPASAFTPDNSDSTYDRQSGGCVNELPYNEYFSAPVYLPPASQVVSITVYTTNPNVSAAYITALLDRQSPVGPQTNYFSASSPPNISGALQATSTQLTPLTIDPASYATTAQFYMLGAVSTSLGFCSMRIAYYAPLGATFLPMMGNP